MEERQKGCFTCDEVYNIVFDVIGGQLKRIFKQAEQIQDVVCDFIPNGNEDEQREHEQQKDEFYYWFDRAEKHGHENREFFLVYEVARMVRKEFHHRTIFEKTKSKLLEIMASRER